jgi:hypothetical protein
MPLNVNADISQLFSGKNATPITLPPTTHGHWNRFSLIRAQVCRP